MDLLLHDIPETVDRALRKRAAATNTTVDRVAADALARGLSAPTPAAEPHDLDWFFGSEPFDAATLAALDELRVVHPEDNHKVDEMLADEARDLAREAAIAKP